MSIVSLVVAPTLAQIHSKKEKEVVINKTEKTLHLSSQEKMRAKQRLSINKLKFLIRTIT
jgi:hypothetical protein